MLLVLLAMEAALLLLTLVPFPIRRSGGGSRGNGLFLYGLCDGGKRRKLGVLFLIAFLAVFAIAVRELFFLNRRTEKVMAEMGRRRAEAAAGSRAGAACVPRSRPRGGPFLYRVRRQAGRRFPVLSELWEETQPPLRKAGTGWTNPAIFAIV